MPSNRNSGIRAARPTIAISGQDSAALAEGLLSLLIVENTSGLYRCEAEFGNWGTHNGSVGFLYFDRDVLDFGKNFQVKLGTDSLFEGRIMGLEAEFPEGQPPRITVLAEDRFQDLRMSRRTRTFSNTTDADLFNQVATDHGLSAQVDVTGPTHSVLAQVNQSDLAFLRDRARSIEAELWIEGSTLLVKSRARRQGSTLQMTHGRELREFSALADLARQATAVIAAGWDVAGKSGLSYEATDSVIQGELNGGNSGASILSSSLGRRKESIVHTVPLTSQEAQVQAEAFFRMSARRFVTGRGLAETDTSLRVGNYVDLRGLGTLFSGKYYLSEVAHLFDGKLGLRTEFVGERPGIG